jgi:hypothetical protein
MQLDRWSKFAHDASAISLLTIAEQRELERFGAQNQKKNKGCKKIAAE